AARITVAPAAGTCGNSTEHSVESPPERLDALQESRNELTPAAPDRDENVLTPAAPVPKNIPLITALPPPTLVTCSFTRPLSFHTRYTPLVKLSRICVSSTRLLVSRICTFALRPVLSQSKK